MVFLGIFYGLVMALLVYGVSFLGARGLLIGGAIPLFILIGKYFIYGGLLFFGFRWFPLWAILTGLVGGIYLGLPILYVINKKWL